MKHTIDLDLIQPIADLFNNTDFPRLRKQKQALVQLLLDDEKESRSGNSARTHVPDEEIDGIIHFIDAFQDAAVAAGIPEDVVFGDITNETM